MMAIASCGGPSQAATVCPPTPTTAIAAPVAVAAMPTVYVFLVDRAFSANGKQSTSYPWPQLPTTALRIAGSVIPALDLKPGDVVVGSWISHNSNDPAEIFLPLTQVAADPVLDLAPSPTPVATPLNKLACNEYALKVSTYNTSAKAWQDSAEAQQTKILVARRANVDAFTRTAKDKLGQATPQRDTLGTDVHGGLAVAAGVYKVNPGARKLVLFSDLADTIGKSVQPDLSGVDVIIALYHRDDVGDQSQAQATWRATLQKLGARSTTFIEWAATTPDKIAQLLGGSR